MQGRFGPHYRWVQRSHIITSAMIGFEMDRGRESNRERDREGDTKTEMGWDGGHARSSARPVVNQCNTQSVLLCTGQPIFLRFWRYCPSSTTASALGNSWVDRTTAHTLSMQFGVDQQMTIHNLAKDPSQIQLRTG
jgi:hypothetical protein